MKAFITKCALTGGIVEKDGEECGDGMFKTGGAFGYFHGEGREWHRTRESAVKRAEEMRTQKIASLKKSIAKLEKLRFE